MHLPAHAKTDSLNRAWNIAQKRRTTAVPMVHPYFVARSVVQIEAMNSRKPNTAFCHRVIPARTKHGQGGFFAETNSNQAERRVEPTNPRSREERETQAGTDRVAALGAIFRGRAEGCQVTRGQAVRWLAFGALVGIPLWAMIAAIFAL